jgi:hypothetical protein
MDTKKKDFISGMLREMKAVKLERLANEIGPLLKCLPDEKELACINAYYLGRIMENLNRATDMEAGGTVPQTLDEKTLLPILRDGMARGLPPEEIEMQITGKLYPLIEESFRYGYYQAIKDDI